MSIWLIILIVLLVAIAMSPPVGVYAGGPWPSGLLTALLLVLLVLALMGRL